MDPIRYSIIIPIKAINEYVKQTLESIFLIDRSDWEVIILPNFEETSPWSNRRVRCVSTGRVSPAVKRDRGAKLARGSILVFLDDDSYPNSDLLNVADKYFEAESTVAIGGPGVTPNENSFLQKVSGAVFLSVFSGGNPERYIPKGEAKVVDDWPSVNLMVRREDFLRVGGFGSEYWPGEDTKLCLELIKNSQKKIIYAPDLIVWHHRRGSLIAHLKQVGNYGLHRGFFCRKFPENSRKLKYFLPSAFLFFVALTLLSRFYDFSFSGLLWIGWGAYGLATLAASVEILSRHGILITLATIPYIFLTHLWYGSRFIQGFSSTKILSKLR